VRLVPLALLCGCLHAPKPPPDVVACVVTATSAAVLSDLVGPLVAGETNGVLTVDATRCGPGVLADDVAARVSLGVSVAVAGGVDLVKLSGDARATCWAEYVGGMAGDLAVSLPGALAASKPVRVEWSAPDCAP